MLLNHNVAIDKFLQFTSSGLNVASFAEIREAVINEYKLVYGDDIDLSTATADGVWINNICLIINNICQACQTLYSNLDINSASGIYLDALCRLANIQRKPATKSVATLQLLYTGTGSVEIDPTDEFIDGSGMSWNLIDSSITLESGVTTSVQVECSTAGEVKAEAGWISLYASNPNVVVTQLQAAVIGSDAETDAELKERRSQASGGDGLTTLDNMYTALLSLGDVIDVKIYNGNSSTAQVTTDGTVVILGSVYVIVRLREGIEVLDKEIGTTIYNKITPGVVVLQSAVSAENRSYTVIPQAEGSDIDILQETMYWRQAAPINPTLTFKLTPTQYANFGNDNQTGEEQEIFESIRDWANGLKLGVPISQNELIAQVLDADPEYQGRRTFIVTSAEATSYENKDTYYNYTSYTYTNSNNVVTITIS